MDNEEIKYKCKKVDSLIYYRRANTSANNPELLENLKPLQIIFPSGKIALGIPSEVENRESRPRSGMINFVVTSPPENLGIDGQSKDFLKFLFTILTVINIVVTILLYIYPYDADCSLVQTSQSNFPSSLERPRNINVVNRTAYVVITLLLLIIGNISVLSEFVLGMTIYALGILFVFFFGIPFSPSFIYTFRFVFDMFSLYVCLFLRTKLVVNYLPRRFRR